MQATWILASFVFLFAVSGIARAAPITVTSANDSGGGSLRAAITAASSGDTIGFAPALGDTILLTSGPLVVTGKTLTITGPAGGITISGGTSVQVMTIDATSNVTLSNLTITDGFLSVLGGGAVANAGTLTVKNCTFSHNQTTGGGGAILNFGNANISGSTFFDNSALEGGALFNGQASISAPPGTMTVINSTFVGNRALNVGGTISNTNGMTTTDIVNCTFSLNSAGTVNGGGIFFNADELGAKITVKSSLLINFGPSHGVCDGTVVDAGYNITTDPFTCGFTFLPGATTKFVANPVVGALGNNGGPTNTIALLAGSPAIDAIPTANCTDLQTPPQPVTTDQRGFPRPDPSGTMTPESACDIGAFESSPSDLVVGNAKVQIVLTGNQSTSQANVNTTFTNHGADMECAGDDALRDGISLSVQAGTCEGGLSGGFVAPLGPFAVHMVNHHSYGTFFGTFGVGVTVSAILTALPTPPGTCGQWNLNFESVGLGVTGFAPGTPLAVLISDADGDTGCFDVPANDTIIGSPIVTPLRRVRRR